MGKKREWASFISKKNKLGSEELQAVLLVQVPAPELLVVLVVGVVSVDRRRLLADELLRGAELDAVAGAEEGGDGHPWLVRVHHGAVPHALISPVAQRLKHSGNWFQLAPLRSESASSEKSVASCNASLNLGSSLSYISRCSDHFAVYTV